MNFSWLETVENACYWTTAPQVGLYLCLATMSSSIPTDFWLALSFFRPHHLGLPASAPIHSAIANQIWPQGGEYKQDWNILTRYHTQDCECTVHILLLLSLGEPWLIHLCTDLVKNPPTPLLLCTLPHFHKVHSFHMTKLMLFSRSLLWYTACLFAPLFLWLLCSV